MKCWKDKLGASVESTKHDAESKMVESRKRKAKAKSLKQKTEAIRKIVKSKQDLGNS